jgi:hypothetical protein
LDQGHYSAGRLEWIGRGEAQHLEANALFEPGGLGERAYRQSPEDRLRLLDEALRSISVVMLSRFFTSYLTASRAGARRTWSGTRDALLQGFYLREENT